MVKNEWHYRINICAKSVIYMAFLAGVLSWLFNQNMIVQSFTSSSKSVHQHSLSIIVGTWPCHYMYMLIISRKFDMCTVISIVIIINLLSSYPVASCASVQWKTRHHCWSLRPLTGQMIWVEKVLLLLLPHNKENGDCPLNC